MIGGSSYELGRGDDVDMGKWIGDGISHSKVGLLSFEQSTRSRFEGGNGSVAVRAK